MERGDQARLHIVRGKYTKASEVLREAVRLDPGNPGAIALLGVVYHDLEQYAQAAEILEILLFLAPKHSDVLRLLGWVRFRQGKVQEAIEAFQESIVVDPDNLLAQADFAQVRQDIAANALPSNRR